MATGEDQSSLSPDISLPGILSWMQPPPDWFELGRKLNIGQRLLESIAIQHLSNGVEKCLSEVLALWLQTNDAEERIDLLAEALGKMDRPDLVKRLRNPPVQTPEENTQSIEADSDYMTAKSFDQSPSTISLDRSLLVLNQCSDLQRKFDRLISDLQIELSPLPLSKIRRFMPKEIKGFYYLKRPSTLEQVFKSVHNYFCYLNHSLIQSVISEFLPGSNIGTSFKLFQEELKGFANQAKLKDMSLFDTPLINKHAGVDFINLTLSSIWLNMSLEHLQETITIIFGEEKNHLTHMKVDGDSLCVTWLAPKAVLNTLMSKSKAEEKFMKQIGVINLTIAKKVLLQRPSSNAEISCTTLNNAVLNCAILGHTKKADVLIALGADPNCSGHAGVTPLMLACKQGKARFVELLMKHNVDVNKLNENGNTALMAAATVGHEEIVKMLLAYSANPHLRGAAQHTAVSIGAMRGHKEVVSLLLWINASPNVQTENGWTPLMYAASHGDVGMVKLLLKCGADIDTTKKDGQTASSIAVENGHMDIVRLIKAFTLFRKKNLTLEESPSPGTIRRRSSIPLSQGQEYIEQTSRKSSSGVQEYIEPRSRKGSLGVPSFHSTTMYTVSQPVPRSLFRPTIKRGIHFHSSSSKLEIRKS